MKTKGTNTSTVFLRKALGSFLAVIMLLSCWVFTPLAPKAEAATAGTYYFKVTWKVTDAANFDQPYQYNTQVNDSGGISVLYKANNGTGTESHADYSFHSDDKSDKKGTYTFTGTISGFPSGIYAYADNDTIFDGGEFQITKLEVGASSTSTLTTLWSGTAQLSTLTNPYYFLIKSDGSAKVYQFGTTDTDGNNKIDGKNGVTTVTAWTSKFPYANTMSASFSSEEVTCPKTSSSSGETNTLTYSATDQYGVTMASSLCNTSISSNQASNQVNGSNAVTLTNNHTGSDTATVPFEANIKTSTSSQTITATCTWAGSQSKTKNATFTVNDAQYIPTFKYVTPGYRTTLTYTTVGGSGCCYGSTPSVPSAASSPGMYWDATNHYTFINYSTSAMTADATYTATYNTVSHSYDEEVASQDYLKSVATCTSPAVYYKSCVCGYSDKTSTTPTFTSGEINSNNHNLIHHEAQAATCTEIGWAAYDTCSRCNYTTYVEIPALGHDWSEWTVDPNRMPTCTETGVKYRTCNVCSNIEEAEVEMLPHSVALAKEAAAPTCTVDGNIQYWYCCDCEKLFSDSDAKTEVTQEETVIPALDHDIASHEAKAPTPDEIGWNAYNTCSRCDYTTFEMLPATGHSSTAEIGIGTAFTGKYEYVGVVKAEPDEMILEECGDDVLIEAKGTYGTLKVNSDGTATYTPKTMQFTNIDTFWLLTKIENVPNEGDVSYAYEEVKVVPTRSLYFEDDFVTETDGEESETRNGIVFTNGTDLPGYGVWTECSQSVDPEDFSGNYEGCISYSGNKAHKVSVSEKATVYPKAEFTFAGTGFEIISTTDSQSGVFVVTIKNGEGVKVKTKMVDTYYGYTYGLLYYRTRANKIVSDKDKNFSTYQDLVPLYPTGLYQIPETDSDLYVQASTKKVYTTDPAKGSSTEQAYGWYRDENGETSEVLYQIPVLNITGLAYGTYTVTIEARFSKQFGHYSFDENGRRYYNLCFDAVRIFDPAANTPAVQEAYEANGEGQINYVKMKESVKGAGEDSATGLVLIDGGRVVDAARVADYTKISPNNELYLSQGQSIAFEFDSRNCKDIQIGMREANGMPVNVELNYNSAVRTVTINTATEIYYSLHELFETESINGIVLVKNTNTDTAILSFTNLKSIRKVDSSGDISSALPMLTAATPQKALSLLALPETDLSIKEDSIKTEVSDSVIVITAKTSDEVKSLVIRDENGNIVDAQSVESFTEALEDESVTTWKVTLINEGDGEYAYSLKGLNEFGFEKEEETEIKVTLTKPAQEEPAEQPDKEQSAFVQFFTKIFDFFKKILSIIGINF